jgi:hypothetical protein
MVKKFISVFLSILMLGWASLALAGGPPVRCPAPYPVAPCTPYQCGPYARAGVPSNYWGDAPFPGICGGCVALPFLVVGSLLGGNAARPYGPPPTPGYGPPAPCGAPAPCAPPVSYTCIQRVAKCAPPPAPCAPPCAPACGPAYGCGSGYGNGGGMSIFSACPCLQLCAGLLGSIGGGSGFLY